MHSDPRPPSWPLRFLRWYCKPALLEEIEGDLCEEFHQRTEARGLSFARWMFFIQVISFFRPFALKTNLVNPRHAFSLMWHFGKVARRHAWRNKMPSLIRITGLSIGLATCLLVMMFVQYERSFENFHDRPEDIYRVVFDRERADGTPFQSALIPMGMFPEILAQAPQVEAGTQFHVSHPTLSVGDRVFTSVPSLNADSNFFSVFHFPMANGNQALFPQGADQVLLTEQLATKLFGSPEKALDQSLEIWNWRDSVAYRVGGILQNPPSNSHVQFELVYPQVFINYPFSWNAYRFLNASYVKLKPEVDVAQFQATLDQYVKTTGGDTTRHGFSTQPLLDIHLKSDVIDDPSVNGSLREVYLFSGIALLILLISMMNYLLTVIADFSRRIREVGIRKTTGALGGHIASQFFAETLFHLLLTLPLVALWVVLATPVFAELMERPLDVSMLFNQQTPWVLLGATLLLLLVVGTYPAWMLARTSVISSLKGRFVQFASARNLQRGLLFGQFAISLALICSLAVIYQQMDYVQSLDLGFDRQNKLVVALGYGNPKTAFFKQHTLRHPAVQASSVTSWVPARSLMGSVVFQEPKTQKDVEVQLFSADEHLLDAYGLELIEGRSFPVGGFAPPVDQEASQEAESTNSTVKNIIVNEAFLQQMQIEHPIGKLVTYSGNRGVIKGVVKDFHVWDLFQPIHPITYEYSSKANYLLVNYEAGQEKAVLEHLREGWHSFSPEGSLQYFFLDDHLDQVYAKEDRLMRLIALFAAIAIGLSCLGVFGLASLLAQGRTREISIRKVLGADWSHILVLLNKEFVWLMLLAMLVALPVSIYGLQQWLEQFSYRIQLHPREFIVGLVLLMAIVLLTVSWRSLLVIQKNPATTLKEE